MRTVVCAYSEVGYACLDELLGIGADVCLVVTHRDTPGETIWFGSVAERARAAGVPVVTPDDVNAPEALAAIADARPELLYSFYFRQMMKAPLLRLPSAGALNLHGSLLPRYRGRAPVNWVLVNGESETGVTLHDMDEKPDHGDIVAQRRVAVTRDDTALSLTRKLAAAGREVIREAHPALVAGTARRRPQDHSLSSYFGGRRPADGEIDWARSAEEIRNLVRAVTEPWPGAFTSFRGAPVIVWWAETRPETGPRPGEISFDGSSAPRVATGGGSLDLVRVGVGGRVLSGVDWARAVSVRAGEAFDRAAIPPATAAGIAAAGAAGTRRA